MENFKKGFKKFGKGIFAIFMIKLCIIGVVILVQACSNDSEILEGNSAKNHFIESLQLTKNHLQSVKVYDKKELGNIMLNKGTNTPTLTEIDFIMTDPNKDGIGIENFGDLVDLIDIGDLIIKTPEDECIEVTGTKKCLSVFIDDSEISNAMQPSITSAKNYLYTNGFTNTDILEVLNGENEIVLVSVVQTIISAEDENPIASINSTDYINFVVGVQTTNAQNWGKIGKCALEALGLDDISELRDWKKIDKKARKKLVRTIATKVAARAAGFYATAAFMAFEFTMCMW